MVHLSVNEVLMDVDSEKMYRILWLDENYVIAYVIDVLDKKALPFIMKIKDIEEKIKSGDYTLIINDISFFKRKLTDKDIAHRDRSWGLISEMITKVPDVLQKNQRKKLITEAMLKHNIKSHVTFYRLLRKYWQRGMIKDSLLPDYALNKKEANYVEKTGRPKKNGKKGIIITEEVKNQFSKSVKKYYLSKKKPSLNFAFKMMINDYYVKLKYYDENGDNKLILKPEEERPTFRQFQYWFNKNYNHDEVTIGREGIKKYEQNYRSILGSSTAETSGPGDIYQIDATPGNVYLVNRFNPNWMVGRPTTYFIVDVYTHLITGLYVGIENASWKAMMNAIVNACMDKVEYCKKFGINITTEMWPSMHLPSNFIGDRGELASKGVDHLIEGLGPHISNTPPYRPDWKGIVESLFGTSQEKIKPFLPGYVHEDYGERGAKDYRLEASLTIEEYTKILINYILFYNHNFYMKDYVRSEEQINDNVQPIPIKLWEWGVKNAAGKLHKHSIDKVKFYLLPREKATITEKGIKYKTMNYITPLAIEQGWFSRARLKGSWKVEFSYDPRNMDTIYLHTNDEKLFIPCTLVEHHSRFKNKTIEEIEQLIEFEQDQYKNFEHTQLENELNFYSNIENIVKAANKNKKENLDKSLSKTKRTSDIKEHRKEEQLQRSSEEAFRLIENKEVTFLQTNSLNQKEEQKEDTALKIPIKELFKNRGRSK